MMVLETFSGTQATVLSNTSWSSWWHTESTTRLTAAKGYGHVEEVEEKERDTAMAEGNHLEPRGRQ